MDKEDEFLFIEWTEEQQRTRKLSDINTQINSLYDIMSDINQIVHQQQEDIDILDKSIDQTKTDTIQTMSNIQQINKNQSRSYTFVSIIVSIGVLLLSIIR